MDSMTHLISTVDLLLPLDEFLLLVGEVHKLVEGLLVDMAVLLQLSVTLVQLLEQLQGGKF